MTRRRQGAAGFTLLELVVVLAVFALVAVMSLQAIQGAIRAQGRLTEQSGRNAALAGLLVRMRHDLEAAVPLAFVAPTGALRAALEVDADGRGFALSLAGQPQLPGDGTTGLHRVHWRYDPAAGTLSRAVWLSLIPAQTASEAPSIVQMEDVTGFDLFSFGPQNGWMPGWQPQGEDAAENLAALPRAVRIGIDTETLGRVELVERF